MLPDEFVPVAHLPSTRGGKVDRLALPAPAARGADRQRHGPLPRDRIEKELATIWESVLGISPIGRREDFFDLGGTSLQSIDLLTRIEDQFDLILSPSILMEHSTLESLTEWIANRAVLPSSRSLVTLRPSSTGRPLFFLHTGAGYVAKYGQLARRLPDRPVYALQARGLRAENWPVMSVPAMARHYIEEITAVDPTGPYLLAGTCMGGLIAFEMAVQLVRQGRPVGLVALLDTEYPAPKGRRLRLTERMSSPVREAFRILRWSTIRAVGLGRSARWLPTYRSFVQHMNARARRAYRPGFYPGTLTLFLAERHYEGKDLRLLMVRHARDVRTIHIPSDPASLLLPPAVDEVARQLQLCLQAGEEGNAP
jgi:thioesterase domain-containing protein/acyl carrier protein